MKGVARDRGLISEKQPFKCGSSVQEFSIDSYTTHHFCKKWTCEKCRKWKINMYQKILENADFAVTSYVSQRPPAITQKEKKDLDNFLNQLKGQYWTLRSDERVVIITKCKHPHAVRLQSKSIIESLLLDVMEEPWSQAFSQRFTKSRDGNEKRNNGKQVKAKDKKTKKTLYAKWKKFDDPRGEVAQQEYNKLHTDFDRVEWLREHSDDIKFTQLGKEFVESCSAEGCAARLAAPPRYAL